MPKFNTRLEGLELLLIRTRREHDRMYNNHMNRWQYATVTEQKAFIGKEIPLVELIIDLEEEITKLHAESAP